LFLDEVITRLTKTHSAARVIKVNRLEFTQFVEQALVDMGFVGVRCLFFDFVFAVSVRCPAAIGYLGDDGQSMCDFAGLFVFRACAAQGNKVVEHGDSQARFGLHIGFGVVGTGHRAGRLVAVNFGLHHGRQRANHAMFAGRRCEGIGLGDLSCIRVYGIGANHGHQLDSGQVNRGGQVECHFSVSIRAPLDFAGVANAVIVNVHAHQGVLDQTVHDGGAKGSGACGGSAATAAGGESDDGCADQAECEILFADLHRKTPVGGEKVKRLKKLANKS
jgi:hypothetical protein